MAYFGEKVLGNFKDRGPKVRAKTTWREKRPGMSESHLALIRQLPCCVSGTVPGGEAHHLKSGTGERGMSVRSTDKWAVPMAHDPHMAVEAAGTRNERSWFLERGIDPHDLARALWASTGDLAAMLNILLTHRSAIAEGKS